MALHKVRFDNDTEDALEEVCKSENISVAAALKRAIFLMREGVVTSSSTASFEIYKTIDLGPGGYAKAPARKAKRGVARILRSAYRS